MQNTHILILGGYGNFGRRIAENLAQLSHIRLTIAGRNAAKGKQLCQRLRHTGAKAQLQYDVLDINGEHFQQQLTELKPTLVIHTSGPFQGQNYRVPEACIAVNSHYIDLADDRRYVCDIVKLDKKARENKVLLISGASSVPGLSSVVVDTYQSQFKQLYSIEFAIAPGNQAERGIATVAGILSYTGHSYSVFTNGQWQNSYGWLSPTTWTFDTTIGRRHLASINIPDLELFPARYPSVHTVKFYAGLELPLLHYTMVTMAWLAKKGLVKNWKPFTPIIFRIGEWFRRFGSDLGGMKVQLTGTDKQQNPKQLHWVLSAKDGIGPYIPTLSTIILAKKIVKQQLNRQGAMPCLGLFSLAEFDAEARPLGITHQLINQ